MLKQKYKTTPLYDPADRAPLETWPVVKPTSSRAFQIMSMFAKTLWRTRFGKATDLKKGIEWRFFFESMGGLWVKVGQLIAMRTDLYEKDFTRELAKLSYRVNAFPFADVVQIIETSYGRPINSVFSNFEEIPIAAASLAQVHRAKLIISGQQVAVKVQRPYAQEFLNMDMKIIRRLFNFFKNFKVFEPLLLDEMFWELESMLKEEIDFRYEAINLKEAKKRFRKYGIYVPVVYKELSNDKIVVMEFIDGVTMSEYIAARREDPERLQSWLDRNKIKPKKVGSFLLRNIWRQVVEDNYFHGDLQPGNIMLLAKSRIAMIDLGSVGSTDEETLSFYRQQLIAIGKKDYLKAADFTILTSPNIPAEHRGDIRQSVVRGLKGALMKASLTDVDIDQKTTVHNASSDMAKELAKYQVSPNWSMLKLIRTFLTVDPSVVNLSPKIDLQKEWIKYYKEARWRLFKQRLTLIMELPSNLVDSVTLFTKMQRIKATDFKARISKGVMVVAYFLNLIKWALIMAMLFLFFLLIWTYLYQHHDLVAHFHTHRGNWLTHLSGRIPDMPKLYWIMLLIAVMLFIINFSRFIRRLLKPVKYD